MNNQCNSQLLNPSNVHKCNQDNINMFKQEILILTDEQLMTTSFAQFNNNGINAKRRVLAVAVYLIEQFRKQNKDGIAKLRDTKVEVETIIGILKFIAEKNRLCFTKQIPWENLGSLAVEVPTWARTMSINCEKNMLENLACRSLKEAPEGYMVPFKENTERIIKSYLIEENWNMQYLEYVWNIIPTSRWGVDLEVSVIHKDLFEVKRENSYFRLPKKVRTSVTQKGALTTYMHSKTQAYKHPMKRINILPTTGNYKVSTDETESETSEEEEIMRKKAT